jgi:2-oxoglutarate ferredoxin oxidoreductase subunit alpha
MVALGALGAAFGIPPAALDAAVARRLEEKGEKALRASREAMAAGARTAAELDVDLRLAPPVPGPGRWLLSGNEAVATGALRGGVRFVAAYPITPATEIVEWLAPALPRLGGRLVQAEDELAALNLALGASFGGVPSMTATSGPGLSLMVETIGLAVAAEIPVLIVDVQRGGPSTGIPTKSEQADLNLAVYGVHGDAPHVVVAPLSVADAIGTTQWAVELAETLQVPVVLLSDQAIGQTRMVIDAPPPAGAPACRVTAGVGGDVYRRYAVTPSGVSPMATPGSRGHAWVADGLEHGESGAPSSAARDHLLQLGKRAAKLAGFDFGDRWAEIDGDGDIALVTWGAPTAAAKDAVARARADGLAVKHVALRLLAPVPREHLLAALSGARRVLLIEQNHGAQLLHLLRAHAALPADVRHVARPGPLPLRAHEIYEALRDAA